MDHYLDIFLLPDAEFSATVLMNAVFSKFHKALCSFNTGSIGVSFPQYHRTLGSIIRLHGEEAELHDLQGMAWLGGMSGYCRISEIRKVPKHVQYRTVSRKQPTMSQSKFRRLIKRGSISEEQKKQYDTKLLENKIELPYLDLVSGSNGHKHRRYIELGQLLPQPVLGKFDQFGLSKNATIPWFE